MVIMKTNDTDNDNGSNNGTDKDNDKCATLHWRRIFEYGKLKGLITALVNYTFYNIYYL